MNNTNTKEVRSNKANKANKANTNNNIENNIVFPKIIVDNIDNVIEMLENNMKNTISYFKQIASDPNALKDIKTKNEKTKNMVDGMLKNKAIDESQAKKLIETLTIPEVDTSWGIYPINSSKYDSFYKEFSDKASKDNDENCLQSLTLYCLLTRASIYALKQYKQYSNNINENSNIITDRINKDNSELFIKRCNSQCKRSGQNYKIGKNALDMTSNIDDMLK